MGPKYSATKKPALTSNNAAATWQGIWSNPRANYFPSLPVLDNMAARVKAMGSLPDMKGVVFIGVQHLLQTTGSLFETLIALGALPENMFFAGKCYSTDPGVVRGLKALGMHIIEGSKPGHFGEYRKEHRQDIQALWQALQEHCKSKSGAIKKIVIISDGAALIENAPVLNIEMVSIEQTRHGRYSKSEQESPFPIINVAQSAAKQLFEPLLIQKAAIDRLKPMFETIDKASAKIGVAGYGAIGKALVKYLIDSGYNVLVYDRDEAHMKDLPSRNIAKNLTYLMVNSHYIFGCTGQDITEEVNLLGVNGHDRFLISLSSGDDEFNTIIQEYENTRIREYENTRIREYENTRIREYESMRKDSKKGYIYVGTRDNIAIETKAGNKIYIRDGGFPINFSGAETPDPPEHFSLTRGLLLGAVVQALKSWRSIINTPSKDIMLDPGTQQYVVATWRASSKSLQNDPQVKQLPMAKFENSNLIAHNSIGTKVEYSHNVFAIPTCTHKSKTLSKL